MYSQNDEETIIVNLLAGVTGRFLDIGAYDGKTFSNTRRLLELGWSGVMVEPSPAVFTLLRENVAVFGERVGVLQVAVGAENGPARFFDSGGDAVSTTLLAHVEKWKGAGVKFTETEVKQITPATLIELVGDAFEFVNIDVEGLSTEVIELFPWKRLTQCRVVCVEHDGNDDRINSVLTPLRFRRVHRNPENLILTR